MASDIFLRVENVEGESRDSTHEGEIDVLSWDWGMTQSGSFHVGGGGGSGKVSIQDLAVTKFIDRATPALMAACASGKHIPKATLTVRKAGGEPLEYLVIEMERVLVSSITTGGDGDEDRLTENVSLNFARVKATYTPQTERGGAGNHIEFAWDIETNAPA